MQPTRTWLAVEHVSHAMLTNEATDACMHHINENLYRTPRCAEWREQVVIETSLRSTSYSPCNSDVVVVL